MSNNSKYTSKTIENSAPEYLINFKTKLTKSNRKTLSTLLGQPINKGHKGKSNTHYYFFSKHNLSFQEVMGISIFHPLKLMIYPKDLANLQKKDPLVETYPWLKIIGTED
jgi:hypothetical protein